MMSSTNQSQTSEHRHFNIITDDIRMVARAEVNEPLPNDLIAFLPYACRKFHKEEVVIFTKNIQPSMTMLQSTHRNKNVKSKDHQLKSQVAMTPSPVHALSSNHVEAAKESDPKNTIVINVIYDNAENICHLKFNHKYVLPRILMKIIGMTVEYQKDLNGLTFSSYINKYTIHEINKFLPISHITDVCFDNCVVQEANYDILLDHARIRNISLARCSLDDDFVIRISSKIRFPKPASKTLDCLNLSSNRITDVGAISLAEALRMNRHLRYLNLSGNQINDEGAVSILSLLLEHPLTVEEILLGKEARFDYERALANAARDLDIESKESKLEKGKRKGKFAEFDISREMEDVAKAKAVNIIGPFVHPFKKSLTFERDGYVFSVGNITLCHLNLAYNNLTIYTLKKILAVLEYRSKFNEKFIDNVDLINVIIEGNRMPSICNELDKINDILEDSIMKLRSTKLSKWQPKSSRKSLKIK